MGSVKDLKVIKSPTASEPGIGNFKFSDRYSVFDWGEMPDHISNKGKALCLIGAYFFEQLQDMGIRSHYVGLLENAEVKPLSQVENPVDTMQVKLVRVLKPPIVNGYYDYSSYQSDLSNLLVPLEIIYRNSLPKGSSVFKRLANGSLQLEEIGLREMPLPGQRLSQPILDYSTKLEASDRYMSVKEAMTLAALSTAKLETIRETTLQANQLITREAERIGLSHEDGKVEFGVDENGEIILVDVLGTPDECRFSYEGIPVSKEVARIFYRGTSWYQAVEQAKGQGTENWKENLSAPPPLPAKLSRQISELYMAFCNEVTRKKWFSVPSLKSVLEEMQQSLAGSGRHS